MNEEFKLKLQKLVDESKVVIDRPKGSTHPRYRTVTYPLDYGYLKDTTSADGEGIDVWLGSGDRATITGLVVTCDVVKKDVELKLLLGCDEQEVTTVLAFLNNDQMSATLVQI